MAFNINNAKYLKYYTNPTRQDKFVPQMKITTPIDIILDDSSYSSEEEEIDLEFIIIDCPSTATVRDFFKAQMCFIQDKSEFEI